jgi:hypothetical protein
LFTGRKTTLFPAAAIERSLSARRS